MDCSVAPGTRRLKQGVGVLVQHVPYPGADNLDLSVFPRSGSG
jgi:hypothetical protein